MLSTRPSLVSRCTRALLLLGLCAALGACSSAGPIASTPLRGKVGGSTFEAKRANLTQGKLGGQTTYSLSIYDAEVPCRDLGALKRNSISIALDTWKSGFVEEDLAGKINVLGFVQFDGKALNTVVAAEGRMEVVEATSSGGTLRIRARYDDNNDVEGEVRVVSCDK